MNSININGRLVDFSSPKIMGILNLTPDSFYDGNQYNNVKAALSQVRKMIVDGVDIIDIGAASSRPGAEALTAEEEIVRLKPILSEINGQFPEQVFSIDTYHHKVAIFAAKCGVSIVNDISAFEMDPMMLDFIAESRLPYVIMHMQGSPRNMQANPAYDDVSAEVLRFFVKKLRTLQGRGVTDVIVDPGFGFGKSIDHNYELLSKMNVLRLLERPILVGLSRKSMIYRLLNIEARDSLAATTALHLHALSKGTGILRVHDVSEAKQAIELHKMIGKHN